MYFSLPEAEMGSHAITVQSCGDHTECKCSQQSRQIRETIGRERESQQDVLICRANFSKPLTTVQAIGSIGSNFSTPSSVLKRTSDTDRQTETKEAARFSGIALTLAWASLCACPHVCCALIPAFLSPTHRCANITVDST